MRPTPAEIDGFDMLVITLSSNGRAVIERRGMSDYRETKHGWGHTFVHVVESAGVHKEVGFYRPVRLARDVRDEAEAGGPVQVTTKGVH